MILRSTKPARQIAPKNLTDPALRRVALARAEAVARSASLRADAAWLDALHPIQRAEELRRRDIAAQREVVEMQEQIRDVEAHNSTVAPVSRLSAGDLVGRAIAPLRADAETKFIEFDFDAALASGASTDDIRRDYAAAVEGNRAVKLMKLCAFGAKHGVEFDAAVMIADGTTLEAAREAVSESMVRLSESLAIDAKPLHPSAAQASDAQSWDTALSRVLTSQGIKPRASR